MIALCSALSLNVPLVKKICRFSLNVRMRFVEFLVKEIIDRLAGMSQNALSRVVHDDLDIETDLGSYNTPDSAHH